MSFAIRSAGSNSETGTGGENRSPSSSSTQGVTGMPGMINSPGMQSLMQQIVDNPQLMQSMMNAPYVQSMFQQMGSNPQLAEQMILNNPLFASAFTLTVCLALFCINHLFFNETIIRQPSYARTNEDNATNIHGSAQ